MRMTRNQYALAEIKYDEIVLNADYCEFWIGSKISLITKLFLIFMKFVSWAGISIVFSVR